MRAVSLLYCMIDFDYEHGINYDVINDSISVYSQAWDFMDFVDSSDPDANLVSLAADKEFDTLQQVWNKRSDTSLNGRSGHSYRKLNGFQNKEHHLAEKVTTPSHG